MGRRGSGGRSPSNFNHSILLRRLNSFKIKNPTIDETVDYLRSHYPDYNRIKLQPFTKSVQKFLNRNKNKDKPSPTKIPKRFHFEEDEDDVDNGFNTQSPARKKSKKANASEERLLRIESEHRARTFGNQDLVSSESESDSSESEEDGAVSTSEDGIYGAEVDPEFDLMKSMLRASYSGKKAANLEEEVEVGDKPSKLIHSIVRQGGGDDGKVGEKEKGTSVSAGGSGDIKGKEDGPRFRDLGGMDAVLEELKMEVIVPLYHPQLPLWLGVRPMAGILLHGPPGCGKTKLAHAIANETGVPFYKISATEVVSGVSGASEENIRDLFSKAYRTAPSIVFIDEIDAIASKRENLQREMERRIVTQLMTCMDESHRLIVPTDGESKSESSDRRPGYVLVIGATNRPDAVDPALRRPGRFDREIVLGVPDEAARIKILSVLTRDLRVEGSFDLTKLARSTPGFVGADLAALANKAGNLAMKRIIDRRKTELLSEPVPEEQTEEWWKQPWMPEEMERLNITMADFEEAAKVVQPSLRREGFSTIPNVKWEDVGGLDTLRHEFDRHIVRRIKYPEKCEEFGVDIEIGFLLYGPPGCGKTLIAKAVANEAGANFIHVKGPELLNKYVGESELAVRTIFSRARTCSPCIIFFDEVDALTTKRGREGGWVVERLLNQLLIELDGAERRCGVFVIGATNRPEVMDRAMLRPGRFGKLLYVPLPSPDERGLILKALAGKRPIDADADLVNIGRKEACENLSGADLAALMNEAAMVAREENWTANENTTITTPSTITLAHFETALQKISPSVSDKQKQYYQKLYTSMNGRSRKLKISP